MRRFLKTTALLFSMITCSANAFAFGEDICIAESEDGTTHLENCYDAKFCGPDAEDYTRCRVNAVLDAASAMNIGRSIIHTDSTYILAQAIGFRSDVAYWLAAYNQAVDNGIYEPFDMHGDTTTIDEIYTSARINGWLRTSSTTGGFGVHFPAIFRYSRKGIAIYPNAKNSMYKVDGAHPHLDDAVTEGMIYHARQWAFQNDAVDYGSCVNGFTTYDPIQGSFFSGNLCYRAASNAIAYGRKVPKWIVGLMPTLTVLDGTPLPFSVLSGDTIAQYDTEDDGSMSNIIFDKDLSTVVAQSAGTIYTGESNEQAVPANVARMGIYLHMLLDRISHYQCGDASTVQEPSGLGRFKFNYSTTECTQDKHAVRHYEEVGFPPDALPERDYSALRYMWDELVEFSTLHPEYLAEQWSTSELATRKEELIGTLTPYNPGKLIADVIAVSGGCERVNAAVHLIDSLDLEQFPGYSATDDACAY